MKIENKAVKETCPICCRMACDPFRAYEDGKLRFGCVSEFHTGHLVDISESNFWHNRPAAKAIRRSLAAYRKAIAR